VTQQSVYWHKEGGGNIYLEIWGIIYEYIINSKPLFISSNLCKFRRLLKCYWLYLKSYFLEKVFSWKFHHQQFNLYLLNSIMVSVHIQERCLLLPTYFISLLIW
jgi:hypothetical protein